MEVRELKRVELEESLPLVWDVFLNYEAVKYTEDGKKMFFDAIHSKEYLDMLQAYGAFDNQKLIGVIATRNHGCHVALFFVDGRYHQKGIGRQLWNHVLKYQRAERITVHSSLFAVPVYKKLGFRQIGEITQEDGITYVPMEFERKQPVKMITLMEDNLCSEQLVAEHGLSLYIETDKHKILVDTGQTELTWNNAVARGVCLSDIDTVFLSHGHYDHSGGLMSFTHYNTKAEIYLRENAGGEYYSKKRSGEEVYIGIDKEILKLPNLHFISENTRIDEELFVFTGVKPTRSWPKGNRRLHEKVNDEYVQDTFSHEQYLVIHVKDDLCKHSQDRFQDKQEEKEQYILVSGCAHNGILNILDAFRDIYHTDPTIVVSGFHMIRSSYTEEDFDVIREIAQELKTMDTIFYTGHCTGEKPFEILKEIMGEQLQAIWDL